jgi:hypothetical protein
MANLIVSPEPSVLACEIAHRRDSVPVEQEVVSVAVVTMTLLPTSGRLAAEASEGSIQAADRAAMIRAAITREGLNVLPEST